MIKKFKEQIKINNKDAKEFISENITNNDNFMYLDPPYYIKGQNLYKNFYGHEDHKAIAELLSTKRSSKWVVSYDDVKEIRSIYGGFDMLSYSLNYSAGKKGLGNEIMYFSNAITPADITRFSARA